FSLTSGSPATAPARSPNHGMPCRAQVLLFHQNPLRASRPRNSLQPAIRLGHLQLLAEARASCEDIAIDLIECLNTPLKCHFAADKFATVLSSFTCRRRIF